MDTYIVLTLQPRERKSIVAAGTFEAIYYYVVFFLFDVILDSV